VPGPGRPILRHAGSSGGGPGEGHAGSGCSHAGCPSPGTRGRTPGAALRERHRPAPGLRRHPGGLGGAWAPPPPTLGGSGLQRGRTGRPCLRRDPGARGPVPPGPEPGRRDGRRLRTPQRPGGGAGPPGRHSRAPVRPARRLDGHSQWARPDRGRGPPGPAGRLLGPGRGPGWRPHPPGHFRGLAHSAHDPRAGPLRGHPGRDAALSTRHPNPGWHRWHLRALGRTDQGRAGPPVGSADPVVELPAGPAGTGLHRTPRTGTGQHPGEDGGRPLPAHGGPFRSRFQNPGWGSPMGRGQALKRVQSSLSTTALWAGQPIGATGRVSRPGASPPIGGSAGGTRSGRRRVHCC